MVCCLFYVIYHKLQVSYLGNLVMAANVKQRTITKMLKSNKTVTNQYQANTVFKP